MGILRLFYVLALGISLTACDAKDSSKADVPRPDIRIVDQADRRVSHMDGTLTVRWIGAVKNFGVVRGLAEVELISMDMNDRVMRSDQEITKILVPGETATVEIQYDVSIDACPDKYRSRVTRQVAY